MKRNARVVLNRQKADAVRLGLADGLFALASRIITEAQPPDLPVLGVGLVDQGGAAVWIDGKKVDGMGLDGKQPRKPRSLQLLKPGITAVAGWGFPARFEELGTIRQSARPFLTPSATAQIPSAVETVGLRYRQRMGGR